MEVAQIITYASIAVFLIAVVARFTRIARLPIHLRWELYPVAHEKGKARYGGSYFEEPEWWTKPREVSHLGELKVMVPEILLLKGVWEHNKSHWLRSFPFHFGLYLLIGLTGLLLVGGIARAAGAEVSAGAGGAWGILHHLTYVLGYAGLGVALVGSLALLGRRVLNSAYREYTKKSDFVNLVFFVVTLGVAFAAHLTADPEFAGLREYFRRLVTFDLSAAGTGSPLVTAELVLVSLLIAYVPLTHMSHFFTKWFMYHDIRWSDEPSFVGGKIERKLMKVLNYPVSWSAPHIGGDRKKTWVDVATSDPQEEAQE